MSLSTPPLQPLIDSLRATDRPVCLQRADQLAGLLLPDGAGHQHFDLHLRSANLNPSDALLLVDGMQWLSAQDSWKMRSFSVSYNPTLEQVGIITLVKSLPPTVADLGMVGCDMDDQSALVLLEWARRATMLKVICIEENHLSSAVKNQFTALRSVTNGMMVIV